MFRTIVFLAAIAAAANLSAGIKLADNGKAVAEIVVAPEASATEKFAADELQLWVEKISGAKLPILDRPGAAAARIVLGCPPGKYPADLEKLKGNDGYAVRAEGRNLYLFASCPKGVLNGVYRLLFKNTDIIWARPNQKFGTVYSANPNLELAQTDYLDVPAFTLRGWFMLYHNPALDEATELWEVRNCCNWNEGRVPKKWEARWRKFGFIPEFGGGHNIVGLYITEKKYFDKKPEFFIMKKGQRVRPSAFQYLTQLCFSNKELPGTLVKELEAQIQANPHYETYRVMIEDNYNSCECPECLKPIVLPDGSVVKPEDVDFRSTQFFLWLNQIAEPIYAKHPDKKILTFAYFFTETPPRVKLAPNIYISYCPINKDSKQPLDGKSNKEWNDKFLGWTKVTNKLTWREYYGWSGIFPRPMDEVAAADLRYIAGFGVNRVYSENFPDAAAYSATWDANAMHNWVMTELFWNPAQDVGKLRSEFLKRVYGPGAGDVAEFYRLIRESWFSQPSKSLWDDSASAHWFAYVARKGLEKPCRDALATADKLVVSPNGKWALAAVRAQFEGKMADAKNFKLNAKLTKAPPAFDPDFNTGDWAGVQPVETFYGQTAQPKEKTMVKMLYDDHNLYFGVKCFDKAPGTLYAKPAGQKRGWPVGDKVELRLAVDGVGANHQLAYDINGNSLAAVYVAGKASEWKGAFQIKTRLLPDGWSSMVTVPFAALGFEPGKGETLSGMFVRYWNHGSANPENSSSFGVTPVSAADFPPIVFQAE